MNPDPSKNGNASQTNTTPVTFRLPSKNERDPWFHLSRSWYYAAESRGDLKMIRLRAKGKTRGVTLVEFETVRVLIMGKQ